MSRENKTKLNLMIKSDEETVGKFNRIRIKKDISMKASPAHANTIRFNDQ